MKRKYQSEASCYYLFDIDYPFPYKPSYLKAHNYPRFWWTTEWNLICDEFNPEKYEDMEWFRKNVAGCFVSPKALKYIPFAKSDDDFPVHEIYEIEVVQYKVVNEMSYPIDMNNYISDYIEENIRRRKETAQHFDIGRYYPSLRYYWRNPQTTNEKRQQLSKEEKRYYQENGWPIQERSKEMQGICQTCLTINSSMLINAGNLRLVSLDNILEIKEPKEKEFMERNIGILWGDILVIYSKTSFKRRYST